MDPEQTIRELLNAIRERNTFEARERFEDLMVWIAKGGFITGRTPEDEGWVFRAAVREDQEVTLSVDRKGGVEQGGETRVVPLHAQQVALLATTSILYPAPVEDQKGA